MNRAHKIKIMIRMILKSQLICNNKLQRVGTPTTTKTWIIWPKVLQRTIRQSPMGKLLLKLSKTNIKITKLRHRVMKHYRLKRTILPVLTQIIKGKSQLMRSNLNPFLSQRWTTHKWRSMIWLIASITFSKRKLPRSQKMMTNKQKQAILVAVTLIPMFCLIFQPKFDLIANLS